jgi:hypothetical protein
MDVFVSSPFSEGFDSVFRLISEVASERALQAYRVDEAHMAEPIAETIRKRIRESRLVVADITDNNANVLNEIGQAQVLGKPLVLISQNPPADAPFNIRDLRILRYRRDDAPGLRSMLQRALSEATSPNETLRSMLVPGTLGHPTKDTRFVIAASPLSYRRATGRHGGYKELRRTSSDHVGIRGVLQAFGLLYGFEALPDIIDPEDFDDGVIKKPMNIYSISSPKANRWTGLLLDKLQETWAPKLEFRADPVSRDLRNIAISLYSGEGLVCPPGLRLNVDGDRYYWDFGLILRAPSPYHDNCSVTILAGRSSLGTEAACRAFTDPAKIDEIRRQLRGLDVDIENHRQAFWAIASMERAHGDGREEAIPETLKLYRADRFTSL